MNMCELIVKKKRGGRLNEKEIDWIVQGYTAGEIPDYQMSAMLMAICFTMGRRSTSTVPVEWEIRQHWSSVRLRQQREFLSQRCPAEDWDIREVRSTNWKVSMVFIPV